MMWLLCFGMLLLSACGDTEVSCEDGNCEDDDDHDPADACATEQCRDNVAACLAQKAAFDALDCHDFPDDETSCDSPTFLEADCDYVPYYECLTDGYYCDGDNLVTDIADCTTDC